MVEKLKRHLYLGLDTSAYTTSLALVDQEERLLFDSRLPLGVEKNSLGLRQSEAVFSHIKNLPLIWQGDSAFIKEHYLAAVAAATRPRPDDQSYMPVFKVSEAFGLFLAQTMGLKFLSSSHQEGHIYAGLWSAGLQSGRYLVLHLSGGTTEIVSAEEIRPGCLDIEILGGSADLNAGQYIDRLGLLMGLDFPAGPQLEKLAEESKEEIRLPVAVKDNLISFSGPASQAERMIDQGLNREDLARAIEVCIADSLISAVDHILFKKDHFQGLLAVGGVMSNMFIRERFMNNLKELDAGLDIYFADPAYTSDNAVGLAVQAARRFNNYKKNIR